MKGLTESGRQRWKKTFFNPRARMAGETLSVAYVPKRVTDNDDDDDRLKYGHRNRQSLIKLTKTGRNTQNGANLP